MAQSLLVISIHLSNNNNSNHIIDDYKLEDITAHDYRGALIYCCATLLSDC